MRKKKFIIYDLSYSNGIYYIIDEESGKSLVFKINERLVTDAEKLHKSFFRDLESKPKWIVRAETWYDAVWDVHLSREY